MRDVPEVLTPRTLALRARRFWAWFLENELELFEGGGQRAELLRQLRKVHGKISAEIEELEHGNQRLLITANGIREAIEPVQMLDAEAPPLRLFQVQFFRAARGELEAVTWGEFTLAPHEVEFAMEADREGRQGLTLFIRGFDRKDRDGALSVKAAAVLMLDMALGEVRVAMEVGFIDFQPFDAASLRTRRPLWQLASVFPKSYEPPARA